MICSILCREEVSTVHLNAVFFLLSIISKRRSESMLNMKLQLKLIMNQPYWMWIVSNIWLLFMCVYFGYASTRRCIKSLGSRGVKCGINIFIHLFNVYHDRSEEIPSPRNQCRFIQKNNILSVYFYWNVNGITKNEKDALNLLKI